MYAIVAVADDWGIGNKNRLLFSIREDMNFFRQKTKDSVVIMGRHTLESFPDKKPLKGRINIVLTSHMDYSVEGAVTCCSARDALFYANGYNKEVFVIGGSSVYREFLPFCEKAFITKIHASKPADSFFPNLDENKNWTLAHTSESFYDGDITFRFCEYINNWVECQ